MSPVDAALGVLHGTDVLGARARTAAQVVDEAPDAPAALGALLSTGATGASLSEPACTLPRFRLLAEVGASDLSTARLLEGHLDATAILSELGGPSIDPEVPLGVWASKAGARRLKARPVPGGWQLDGELAYCSGATCLGAALVIAEVAGSDQLFLVQLPQRGLEVGRGTWLAVGMAGSISETISFDGVVVPASAALGAEGEYVSRSGFWAGAIGVAACWAGGALGVARVGLEAAARHDDPHRMAHLGAVVSDWAAMWSLLVEAAGTIDGGGVDELHAQIVRHQVEAGCQRIVERVGRLTGPGPMVHDAAHARRVPDLLVYLRQHHAEADLERTGRLVVRSRPEAGS